jgi:hypothetical protein
MSKPQTLTALADKASAWAGGLGSSVVVIWKNFKMPAARLSTLANGCYFAMLAILQTTTPILFSLVLTTIPHERMAGTVIGTPFLANMTQIYSIIDKPGRNHTVAFDWYSTSTVINLFGSNTSISHPGLAGNRIYDTLEVLSSTNGTATVGYTDFEVTCGMVPGANISTPIWKFWDPSISYNPNNAVDAMFSVTAALPINASYNTKFNLTDLVEYGLSGKAPATNYWAPMGE